MKNIKNYINELFGVIEDKASLSQLLLFGFSLIAMYRLMRYGDVSDNHVYLIGLFVTGVATLNVTNKVINRPKKPNADEESTI